MRVNDRPLPTVVLDTVPTIAGWPVRPVIALEQRQEPAYVWDDPISPVGWDGGGIWDVSALYPTYRDATCAWSGLELEHAPPDDHGNIPASRLVVQLDNRDGTWSAWNADGSPARTGAGSLVHVWAHADTGAAAPITATLFEPFDNFTTNGWSTSTFTIAAGRNGNGAQSAGTSNATYNLATPVQDATAIVGFAVRVSTLATARQIFQLRTDSAVTIVNTVIVEADGSISVRRGNAGTAAIGQTAAGLITANVWFYVECRVTMHDTAGILIVRVNGVERLNLTNVDTKPATTKLVYDSVNVLGNSGGTHLFDDLYVDMGPAGTFKGDISLPLPPPAPTAVDYWLFSGRVARYDQRSDDMIELEAFDVFSDLAQPVGTYTAGANNDLPGVRLAAVVAQTPAGPLAIPTRFDVGTNHLTAQATDKAPLEEAQTVIASDAGVLFTDADGTVVSYGRLWRNGRDDQTAVPVISDNVCNAPIVVWDAVISSTDASLADLVTLENVAHLKSTATRTTPTGRYVLAFTDQQWSTQAEGDATALAYMTPGRPRLELSEAVLYLLDARYPNLWRAVDWRRFDRVSFIHDQAVVGGVPAQINVTALVRSLLHTITPEGGWVLSFSTTAATASVAPVLWDITTYGWDNPDPLAVWTY